MWLLGNRQCLDQNIYETWPEVKTETSFRKTKKWRHSKLYLTKQISSELSKDFQPKVLQHHCYSILKFCKPGYLLMNEYQHPNKRESLWRQTLFKIKFSPESRISDSDKSLRSFSWISLKKLKNSTFLQKGVKQLCLFLICTKRCLNHWKKGRTYHVWPSFCWLRCYFFCFYLSFKNSKI